MLIVLNILKSDTLLNQLILLDFGTSVKGLICSSKFSINFACSVRQVVVVI